MDPLKKYVLKYQFLRLRFFIIPSAEKRSKLLKKKNYFYEMGENVHFQPRKLPADPKFIKFHNNIVVAAGVSFITHDVINRMLSHLSDTPEEMEPHLGCIEVCDNVFIGSGVQIMPNVRIGSNVIIAAGSIVTKDIPDGSVVAGVPAKVIGSFEDVKKKRIEECASITEKNRLKRVNIEWEKFNAQRR